METPSQKTNVQLIRWRQDITLRSHVAMYINPTPFNLEAGKGMSFHAIGSPNTGYVVEWKAFTPEAEEDFPEMEFFSFCTVTVDASFIEALKTVANTVPAPGAWAKPLELPDGVNGRNCESWLIDYVQQLVQRRILPAEALTVLLDKRCGVGLTQAQAQVYSTACQARAAARSALRSDETPGNKQVLQEAELQYQQAYDLVLRQAKQNEVNSAQLRNQQAAAKQAHQAAQQSSIQQSAGGAGNVANLVSMFQQRAMHETGGGSIENARGRG